MIDNKLKTAYNYFREQRRIPALKSMAYARTAIENGNHDIHAIRYAGPCHEKPFAAYGEKKIAWFECPADHFRFAGKAHKIISLRHTGWYIDDYECESCHGVVYQMPASRDGKERFLYGVADPFNDGPALLSLDIADNKEDAAHWADAIAERYAEREKEYSLASAKRDEYEVAGVEISKKRLEIIENIADFKSEGRPEKLRRLVAKQVGDCLAAIRRRKEYRKEIFDVWGKHEGFNSY